MNIRNQIVVVAAAAAAAAEEPPAPAIESYKFQIAEEVAAAAYLPAE